MFRIRLLIAVPFLCYFLAAHGWPSQNLSASTTQMLTQLRDNLANDFSPTETVVSETSQITLRAVKIHGASILGDTELEASVAQFVGVAMTYEQMFEITMTVESYYRQHNYLARVMLPTQDLSSGVLHLEVMESVVSLAEVDQKLEELPNTRPHVDALVESQQGESKSHQSDADADVTLLLSMYQSRISTDEVKADLNELTSVFSADLTALLPSFSNDSHKQFIEFVNEDVPHFKSYWEVQSGEAEFADAGLILQKVPMWHEPLTRRRRFISVKTTS